MQNIKDGSFADERAHIAQSHFDRLGKHRVYGGDILIAALGEELPRACVMPGGIEQAIVKADCIRFKPNADVLARTVIGFLNSPPTRARTKIHGVGRPRLNLDEIRAITVPLPPKEEQQQISDLVAILLGTAERIQKDVLSELLHAKSLRQSILNYAFRGKLTPHCATDEPASILLQRIATERAEHKKQAASKRGRTKNAIA